MSQRTVNALVHVVRTLWIGTLIFVAVKSFVTLDRHSVYPDYAAAARDWPTDGPFESMVSFQYLPYFSDLLAPFAALPNWLGALSWGTLTFALYATGLRAFLTLDPPDGRPNGAGRQLALACGILIGCGSFANHQANVLVAGCWLWAAVAVRKQQWWAAAVLFALPMFKMYTLAPGLVFAALYPRQLGLRLAAVVAALLALPFAFHSAAVLGYRFDKMTEYLVSGEHYRKFPYQTLYEAWRLYVGDVRASWLLPVQALAGLAVPLLLVRLRRAGAPGAEVERHGLFLGATWCISFGPSIEPQTYLVAAPAIGWWLASCAFGPRPNRVAVAGLAVVAVLAGSPLYSFGPGVRDALIPYKIPFLALAALHLGLLYTVRVQTRAREMMSRGAAGVGVPVPSAVAPVVSG
ncbi:DUF2029 domain-containing protein [Limnoglobus roseus]|uniref:DUF2029 domain-containing protein n=1 Tax=Limnoglobus roseus TaxID=2598579 RepID=A0A5C1AS10_9BACT|nr:DUF2029 domain-containing protein [Limnoglobus roseus]QEL20937.1 hypothetical protein PX52LOC_08063 [Limnoglobus roseus]